MMPQGIKRSNDAQESSSNDSTGPPSSSAAPTKKARTVTSASDSSTPDPLSRVLALKHSEIDKLRVKEARDYLKEIQTAYIQLSANKQVYAPAPSAASSDARWTPEKVKERAKKMILIASSEIQKQMKWQPTCSEGRTKWSYQGFVPNEAVFREMFKVQNIGQYPAKGWRMSLAEFQNNFGKITSSMRSGMLCLTGEDVLIAWQPEDEEFKVSGTYGLVGAPVIKVVGRKRITITDNAQ